MAAPSHVAGALAVTVALSGCAGPAPSPLPVSLDPTVSFVAHDGAPWWQRSCPHLADIPLCACVVDYLSLPSKAGASARAVGAAGLGRELAAIDPDLDGVLSEDLATLPLREGTLPPERLALFLGQALGTGFLIMGADTRPLRLAVGEPVVVDGRVTRELTFDDPLLGRFRGLLLTPAGAPPPGGWPALVGLDGHGGSPELFVSDRHGGELVDAGYALLVPELRGLCVDDQEDRATRALLEGGLSLVGVRIAEAALARKALRAFPEVARERVGLIAHSTAALSANVGVRVDLDWAAAVTDLTGDYYSYTDMPGAGWFSDAMAPRLFPYHRQIADPSSARVPLLAVGYGFTPDRVAIRAFFDQHVAGRAKPEPAR